MPQTLSPEDFDAQFGGGFRVEPAPAGMGTRFGAAIDRSQAGLLGVGEAVGLPLEDLRRANQFQSQQSMQRYFGDNPYEPQSYKDVEGVGSALRYARGLAIDSSPELLTSLASGGAGALMGLGRAARVGLAAATNYPAAVGDILQNQREEAGQTNFGTAALLGVPYAAADLVGLDAALAGGRMARTGIRRLDEMQGIRGGLARTGANVALNAPIEGGSETFQELLNQAGRVAVNPRQTMFNPEANERYGESFVGGAALGGLASGAMGGWRRSEQYQAPGKIPEQETDLTQKAPQQYGLVTQPAPLQERIDKRLGIGVKTTPSDYAKQFEEAYNEPSGQYVTDPTTGLEKQLSVGEYNQMQGAPLDLTQPAPAGAAAAATTTAKVERDPRSYELRDTFGVIPTPSSLQLYSDIQASGIPVDSDLLGDVWKFAGDKPMTPKRLERAQQLLDAAIINARKEAPVGTAVPVVSQPAGSVGVGGPVVQGAVGVAGSNAPVQGSVAGSPAAAGAAPRQTGILPSAAPQPAATVDTQAPVVTPTAPAVTSEAPVVTQAAPVPGSKFRRAPKPMTVLEAANAAKAAQAQQAETQGSQAPAASESDVAPEVAATADKAKTELVRVFGERDANILYDAFVEKLPHADIATKYGVGRTTVVKVAGDGEGAQQFRAEKMKAAGGSEATLRSAFDVLSQATRQQAIAESAGQDVVVDKDLEAAGLGTVATEGGAQGNWQDNVTKGAKVKTRRVEAQIAELRDALDVAENTDETEYAQQLRDQINTLESEYVSEEDKIAGKTQQAYELLQQQDALKEKIQAARDAGYDTIATKDGKVSLEDAEDEAMALQIRAEQLLKNIATAMEISKGKTPETKNAVQVESTTGVSVQPKAQAGQGVGKQVRSAEKPAGAREAKPQAQAKILTEAEQAAQAWNVVAAEYPTAPKFADLTKDQQQDFIDFGPDNWTKDDVETELTKLAKSGMKFGKEGAPALVREPYTAKQLLSELKAFIRADIPQRKLMVVESIADLINSSDAKIRAVGVAMQLGGAYGVASDGRAFLIANRIKQGSGRAKFMHEVGGHLGLDNLLTKADQDKLVDQIKSWAKKADGSLEAELALQAFERVQFAETAKEDQRSELIAYFIESAMEMGVNPTAATDSKLSGPLLNWFRTLWAAFKVAARKLGMKPESMTAQDVVNLAYGAARLEINGTWHGTAAAFRNFRNKFIGSGEGATAFGWGTYLAQSVGIAKGYWKSDVTRKTPASNDAERYARNKLSQFNGDFAAARAEIEKNSKTMPEWATVGGLKALDTWEKYGAPKAPEGSLMRVDTAADSRKVYNYDRPISKQPDSVRTALENALEPVADEIVDRTNKDVQELTGKDLIGTGENDLGLLSNLIMDDVLTTPKPDAKFEDAVRRGNFHEAASHYLRALGVEGLTFYDASSRGSASTAISFEGKNYNRDELRDKSREANQSGSVEDQRKFILLRNILRNGLATTKAELEDKVAGQAERFEAVYIDSAARYGIKVDPVAERAKAQAEAAKSYEGEQLAWLKANEKNISIVENPKTRNLVIFDDKNIFRVGGEAAADRQRMKFGKNMPTQATVDSTINKLPKQAQVPVRDSVNTLNDWARKGLDRVVFTSDLINRAAAAGLKTATQFQSLLAKRSTRARELERDVERIADMYAAIDERDKGSGPDSANQFIFDSTRTGKWGYGRYRNVEMGARFDALGSKTQEFVKAVFAHGDKMLSAKKKAVMDYTASEYDARIAAETDPAKKSKLLRDKAADLKKFARLFQIREGIPYAPIKRFGDHVVVAKSKEYIAAVAAKDTKLIKQLEQDPDHYHVSFTETKNEARNLATQLEDQGHFNGGTVSFKERSAAEKTLFGNSDSLQAIERLQSMAKANAKSDDKTSMAMQRLVSDMYLQALAEGSARKSEMRRRGVAGELDMLRSFAAQGRADANFVASVQYNPQVQDALQAMRKEENDGSGDLNRKSELLNEITRRYDSSLETTTSPTINKITRLSSIYYLATSPAYYLQNLTQPWMMSVPAMAGRHDYAKTSGALMQAYSQLGSVMKSARLFDQQFDFDKVPADVRAAIQELVNRGKIDIGMETELGEFKIEGDGALSKGWNKVDKGMRLAVQKVESLNRLSTAMAAYRLELAKTGSKEDAINYADQILTDTHGDYSSFNAPRYFNMPLGKVALQFRKFQLIQLTYYAKLLSEAGFSTEEKRAATKALVYSLGHTALLAGVMGLPGYSAIAWAIGALLGDEDEPYDLTQELRKLIGDEDMANLIMRGAPTLAGMDISGKVGAGTMLSIMPYSQADLTTRAGIFEAFGSVFGGAPVGMAARMADGLGLMLGGNWYKGMEQLLPKGLGDAAKAYRISTEGLTRRNGDILLPPSEISSAETIMQALGIQPVKQTIVAEKQRATLDMNQNFQDRSTKVKADYIKAVRSGESTADARAAWTKLQEARVNNGYTRQPLAELLKAPQSQAKRERQTKDGVQFNKANKRFVEEQI